MRTYFGYCLHLNFVLTNINILSYFRLSCMLIIIVSIVHFQNSVFKAFRYIRYIGCLTKIIFNDAHLQFQINCIAQIQTERIRCFRRKSRCTLAIASFAIKRPTFPINPTRTTDIRLAQCEVHIPKILTPTNTMGSDFYQSNASPCMMDSDVQCWQSHGCRREDAAVFTRNASRRINVQSQQTKLLTRNGVVRDRVTLVDQVLHG